ncbi:hypothetical protein RchiOBHm_Chr3g0463621 [Rosa chinensis]|uniref:Uncharacterized protein n=1 Tax=Rosa chinensis TaxID=74649 RepID=A0A2P6R989_ROSCH|nr:hypothetical protein RchiOBHm_Chr3g0463621 [Rosa chinensis]
MCDECAMDDCIVNLMCGCIIEYVARAIWGLIVNCVWLAAAAVAAAASSVIDHIANNFPDIDCNFVYRVY